MAVDGTPLSSTFRKAFRVAKPDFEAPDIQQWALGKPKAGSKDALKLTLNGPQDHVSLAYRIRVKDDKGKIVTGRIELAKAESVWVFHPKLPWELSEYTITVDPLLEDLAGNRLTGLFEKPLAKNSRSSKKPRTIDFQTLE